MHTYISKDEMQRKNIYISVDLLERAEAVAKEMNVGFSQLVREAVHQFIIRQEQENAERELAAACKNYRDFNKNFGAEWSQFETVIE